MKNTLQNPSSNSDWDRSPESAGEWGEHCPCRGSGGMSDGECIALAICSPLLMLLGGLLLQFLFGLFFSW